jgi:hypothetical protein
MVMILFLLLQTLDADGSAEKEDQTRNKKLSRFRHGSLLNDIARPLLTWYVLYCNVRKMDQVNAIYTHLKVLHIIVHIWMPGLIFKFRSITISTL